MNLEEDSGLSWSIGKLDTPKTEEEKARAARINRIMQRTREAHKRMLAKENVEGLKHLIDSGTIKADKVHHTLDNHIVLVHKSHKEYGTPYVKWVSNDLHNHGIKHSIVDSGTSTHGDWVKLHIHESLTAVALGVGGVALGKHIAKKIKNKFSGKSRKRKRMNESKSYAELKAISLNKGRSEDEFKRAFKTTIKNGHMTKNDNGTYSTTDAGKEFLRKSKMNESFDHPEFSSGYKIHHHYDSKTPMETNTHTVAVRDHSTAEEHHFHVTSLDRAKAVKAHFKNQGHDVRIQTYKSHTGDIVESKAFQAIKQIISEKRKFNETKEFPRASPAKARNDGYYDSSEGKIRNSPYRPGSTEDEGYHKGYDEHQRKKEG